MIYRALVDVAAPEHEGLLGCKPLGNSQGGYFKSTRFPVRADSRAASRI